MVKKACDCTRNCKKEVRTNRSPIRWIYWNDGLDLPGFIPTHWRRNRRKSRSKPNPGFSPGLGLKNTSPRNPYSALCSTQNHCDIPSLNDTASSSTTDTLPYSEYSLYQVNSTLTFDPSAATTSVPTDIRVHDHSLWDIDSIDDPNFDRDNPILTLSSNTHEKKRQADRQTDRQTSQNINPSRSSRRNFIISWRGPRPYWYWR